MRKVEIIAEIGVNHNGDVDLARKMVDVAAESGADLVKFQTFTAEALATQSTPKVDYQMELTAPDESHFHMLKGLELAREDHFAIKRYCENRGVEFISTPYDIDSARFLHEELEVLRFKTASADIVDLPLQRYLASTGKPVLIAAGMATLGEIETVIDIYRKMGNNNVSLLHCVSNYPASDASLNLSVIPMLAEVFRCKVGFSDHSHGPVAAIGAVALGAEIIEKHFTLDRTMPGPDHKASADAQQLKELIQGVRRISAQFGEPVKRPQPEEEAMRRISRKSVTMAQSVRKGETVRAEHLTMKRPGTGLGAAAIEAIIGRRAARELSADAMIDWADFEPIAE